LRAPDVETLKGNAQNWKDNNMKTLAIRPYRKASELRRDELMTVFKQWAIMLAVIVIASLIIASCPLTLSPPTQKSKEVERPY